MMRSRILKLALHIGMTVVGFSLATMWLWNALLPMIFGLPAIGFFQAMGLLVLSRLLFGGLGSLHNICHSASRRERQAMFTNWMKMTPEEREQHMKNAGSHCGFAKRHSTTDPDDPAK